MYEQIEIAALKDMLEVARGVPESKFDMSKYIPDCGTAGCLVGHYKYLTGRQGTAADIFALEPSVSWFLFSLSLKTGHTDRIFMRHVRSTWPVDLNKSQAISRLSKTIRYFVRKRQLWRETEEINHGPKVVRRSRQMNMPSMAQFAEAV